MADVARKIEKATDMPKFIYSPEGAEPREWDFEPRKMSSKEAELIERRTGMHFGNWLAAINEGSMLAYHALLFTYLRRENQSIQWDTLEFTFDEVGIQLSDDEVRDRFVDLERRRRSRRSTSRRRCTWRPCARVRRRS
jgi:hypothetical protein